MEFSHVKSRQLWGIFAVHYFFAIFAFFVVFFFRNRQSYVMNFMSSKRKVTYLEKILNKFPKLAKTHCYKKSPLPLTKCKRKKILFGIVCQVQDWRMAAI